MNIYVSGLSMNVTDDDLRGFFEEFGVVSSARIIMDKFTNSSRGFGFVEMQSTESGKQAIAALHGGIVEGRSITVNEARPREDRGYNNNNNKPSYSGGRNRW